MAATRHIGNALALTLLAGPSFAQQDQIDALDARVAALEDQPPLGFGAGGVDLTIYGYVKADLIYDLDSDLGTTIFGLGSLDPGGASESNFRGQAFQTRLGVRAEVNGAMARIEGDFFGGGGGEFRLRHAYVDVGNLRFGQTWTNFMPIESYPGTLDFQGPAGIPFTRVTQARYTHNPGGGLGFSASIEQSVTDSSDPALTAAAFYAADTFFVKLALLGTTVGDVDGFGVNLSGNAQLWAGGNINLSLTQGEAISSYMVFGGDDTFGGDAVEATGVTLGVTQSFDDWTLGVAYGYRENDIGAPTDTESLETVHLTTKYSIRDNTTAGLEYIIGERELFDGSSASADRVQASIQFDF